MQLFDNRYLRDGVLLLLAVGLVALYVAIGGGGFPLDDSWIHQVYGRNLGLHAEWAFVPGEPSGASTSPLYTVLLAVGYALHVPYMLWTQGLGVVALGLTAILGAHLIDRLLPARFGWITGVALLLTWHLLWAAASGMETMLFSMFTLLLVYLITLQVLDVRQGVMFGAAAALMVATRPEGALLAGLCGLAVLIRDRRQAGRWIVGAVLGFAVLIAPYLLLNLHLNESIFPATASAKQAQHAPLLQLPYTERFMDMVIPIIAGGQLFLLPGVVYFVIKQWRTVYTVPVVWAVGLIALYAARLPASYQHGRYVIPALPGLVVVGVIGSYYLLTLPLWARIGEKLGETLAPPLGRIALRTTLLATGITFVYFALLLGPTIYQQDVQIIEDEMVAPAHWIADNLPEDELLAIHDIGAVGYFAARPILDIAGLVSPEVVPLIGDDEGLWALLQARNARYLMAFPDQIPGRSASDERLCYLYASEGTASTEVGGPKMVIYRLVWDDVDKQTC